MNRKKGNRSRRKVSKFYEEKGYIVDKVEKTHKWAKEKDLFALSLGDGYTDKGFDLIAMNTGEVVFVQVKTNSPATQKWYRDFSENYAGEVVRVVVATVEDYKGIRIQWYQPDGEIEEERI